MAEKFQSTLPVWGATPGRKKMKDPPDYFNPRSPCGERPGPLRRPDDRQQFQSTLPVWGATRCSLHCPSAGRFQSTLPVWGATLIQNGLFSYVSISIHAPRVGSDILASKDYHAHQVFQSTLPVWGATPAGYARVLKGDYFNPRSPCGERRDAWDT